MRKYVWKKKDGYSQPIGLTKLMAIAGLKVVTGTGPFSLTQDGDPIATRRTRANILSRFKDAISGREIGSVFRIRKGNDDVVFTARAIRVADYSTADSTNGNTKSDIYYNWVKSNFKAYDPRYAGSFVCKEIAGSNNLSQHSYGNAVDFFFDTLAHQDDVASQVADNPFLSPYHVISRNRVWTKGVGWHSYGGDYHYHLHVDFDPQYTGGCGVRG